MPTDHSRALLVRRKTVLSLMLLAALTAASVHAEETAPTPVPHTAPIRQMAPTMGWNPWNAFRTEVTEDKIIAIAETLNRSGLKAAGYRYINIDDGWWLKRRADGRIIIRTTMFPSAALPDGETSFRPFTDRLHAMNFKVGIYTDIGRNVCSQAWDAKSPNLPTGSQAEREVGSMGHQTEDMRLFFGEWNFDLVKVDACGLADFGPDRPYVKNDTYRALKPAIIRGRPDLSDINGVESLYRDLKAAITQVRPNDDVILSICTWGEADVARWGHKYGQQWRTSADIRANWASMLHNFDTAVSGITATPSGRGNDPDMLEIGNGDFDVRHLTEARAHMSMWAIIGAPLILGSDLTKWSQDLIDIAGNRNVIAVNQDIAGRPRVISSDARIQIITRPLSTPGTQAVALINRGANPQTASVNRAQLGLTATSEVTLRDLWLDTTQKLVGDVLTVTLAPRETFLVLITTQP
ncbi:glycoside hydrolase family 27 protein [Asticcacaulis machinosus]|uniref:Alpha-galactosidase n=1 Tax=Asticcacaulis machinosus TaxID=2984211 RepID=A0ABT5HIS7_9CAUL|nr:glycoside hydrolase family 27 protein [Asticcacaulis machinosus]MDC7676061.1 glycoside hydrolase family 27 protein [Asticcacaulis machinosus]